MKFALSLLSLAALALTADAQCSTGGCGTTFARSRNVTVVRHQLVPTQYAAVQRVQYVQPVAVAMPIPVTVAQPPTVAATPPVTTTKTTVTTTTTKVAAPCPCPPTVAYAPVATVQVGVHRVGIHPLKGFKSLLCKLLGCG